MGAPKTLPANFDFQNGSAPNTLPADFNFAQPQATSLPSSQPPVATSSNRGPVAAIKRTLSGIVGAPKQVAEAFTRQPDVNELGIAAAPGGQTILGLKRLIWDPMQAEADKAQRIEAIAKRTGNEDAQHLANMHAIASGVPVLGPMAAPMVERYLQGDKSGAITELAANVAAPEAIKKVGQVGKLGTRLAANTVLDRYRPVDVNINGTNVPVLRGEAAPNTGPGDLQQSLKARGVGSSNFNQFARDQQAAVKQVIRKVAQDTAELTGPIPDAPAAAMQDAADATFAKGRPMYQALDQSAKMIPDTFQAASGVVRDAIRRAEKLGVSVGDEIDPNIQKPLQQQLAALEGNPERQAELKQIYSREFNLPELAGEQPITAYMQVRSQLLKIQRATPDAALRNAIGSEVARMNGNIEAALKGTPLWDNFNEANRLWSKGYALNSIADELAKRMKGTPETMQASGLTPNPQTIQGGGLVQSLNDLDADGVLSRGLSPQEAKSLRQAADILDRSTGEVNPRDLYRAGYSMRSQMFHAIENMGFARFTKAMTTPAGVAALQQWQAAATAGEKAAAMTRIASLSQGTGNTQSVKDMRDKVNAATK